MSWATQYIGVPYVEKGRDLSGWDCWGLVRHVLHEQRSLNLPSYSEGYTTSRDREEIEALTRDELITHWEVLPVGQAQPLDGIIFRMMGRPIHFGIVVSPPFFLHAMEKVGTAMERWDSMLWEKRVIGVARWTI